MVNLPKLAGYLSGLQKQIAEDDGVFGIHYNPIDENFEILINCEYFLEIAEELEVPFDEVCVDEIDPIHSNDTLEIRLEFYKNDVLFFAYFFKEDYEKLLKEYQNG